MSILPGIYASQITGHLSTNAYESISTVTVGSGGQSSVTFSSIPSTYKHLQVRAFAQSNVGTTGSDNTMYINGDTTYTNYYSHRLQGDGSTASAYSLQTSSYYIYPGDMTTTSQTNSFTATIVDILDYANTSKNKTVRVLNGWDNNGSGKVTFASGLWNSTSAITSLTFQVPGGLYKYNQYSSFALYGIKG